jgi:hypothetical protein
MAEVRAHDEQELWPKSNDPALLHPMSPRLVQILETYKRLYKETGQEQPFLKNARYVERNKNVEQMGLKGDLIASFPHKKQWQPANGAATRRPFLTWYSRS